MLLKRGVQAIVKVNTERPPVTTMMGTMDYYNTGPISQLQQLQQPANSSWLFSVVGRIARAVASTEWMLLQRQSNQDSREVPDTHPAMQLWRNWNPYMTYDEALETLQQHLSLIGEGWIVKLRNNIGVPIELWPVRPDRMRPIPSPDLYIRGYEYRIGNVRIELEPDDVIFIRRPSPTDPYRGMGPIGALMADLEGEKAASRWTANFFMNNAEPGGILQFDEAISDAQFERLVARWNAQHRGVANAHRVAIIEKGEWKDRKYTQRDMQFEALRRFNRDIVLGAFGMPLPVMGITETVNRANAEAGNFLFARWLVRPELERIRAAVNDRLISQFGPPGLRLDFVDPTPEDHERNLREATEGYEKGILKLNEARSRLGEAAVEGGDEFKAPAPAPVPFGQEAVASLRLKQGREPEIDQEETEMERAWRERLETEKTALLAFLFPDSQQRALGVEPDDVNAFDWNWWDKYGEEVIRELEEAFLTSALTMFPDVPPGILQVRSSEWAAARAARLIRLDGDLNVVNATREKVRELVSTSIREGHGVDTLARRIRDDEVFSRARARMIARTETASALGQGQRQGALSSGMEEKKWVTQGDGIVRPAHVGNAAIGWIPIGNTFPSGQDTIGEGPASLVINCRCTVIYRNKPVLQETVPYAIRKIIERDDLGRISAVTEETNGRG